MREGFEPVVVDTLGGLCTLVERSDLPVGLSPLAKNVEFFPGGVRSRDGFKTLYNFSPETDPPRAIYEHVSALDNRYHLSYRGGSGSLDYNGANPFVELLGAPAAYSTMRAASMYGRAFICVSDGRRGLVPPIQVDDPAVNTIVAPVGMGGAHEATIAFAAGGSMTVGTYFIVVAFETNTGYITGTSKLNYDTMGAAARTIDLSSIPLGPTGVTKRRIFISLPNSFELYNPAGLTINDNSTTTLSGIDLTPADIAAGLPFTDYQNLQPPTAHLGVEGYSNRLVYWGGDGRINPFFGPITTGINPDYSSIGLINLDFSAERYDAYAFNPLSTYVEWNGVTPLGTGTVVEKDSTSGELLNWYRITSNGAATTGLIEQGWGTLPTYRLNRDQLGNYYLNPGRKFGIRARVRNYSSMGSGNLKIVLYEANSVGPTRTALATLTVPMSTTPGTWAIYEGDGSTFSTGLPNVAMSIYGDNLPNGGIVDVAHIEVYDCEAKRGNSSLDISRVFDPESFDIVNGRIEVSPNDGEEIRNVMPLRGNLYIFKEKSMYVTQDNGQEPAFWKVEIVSSTVGTPSVHGVGAGDGWLVIAARDGLYMFDGGAPQKISQEIQPTWNSFDWTKGERIYCVVDTQHQIIYVGGPTATGFQQLRLNYLDGFGSPMSDGNGRKWSLDTRYTGGTETGAFTHAAPITLSDGSRAIAFAAADDGARIVYQDSATKDDYSGYISSQYETAPIGTDMGRSIFGEVAIKIRGAGTLATSYIRPDASAVSLPNKTLSANPLHDIEIRTLRVDTQLGVRVGIYGTGAYFVMKRLAVWTKPSPFSYLRGY